MGLAGEVAPERSERAAAHGRAFSAYLDRRWDEAEAILDGLVGEDPTDEPARILRERCARLRAHSPAEWDGIERMETK